MNTKGAIYVLYALAATLAFVIARQRARHSGVGFALVGIIIVEATRALLDNGAADWRLRALYIAEPITIAAYALRLIGDVSPMPALVAWLVLSCAAADVQAVPNPAGIYRAAHLSVLAAGFAALLARHPFGSSNDGKADEMGSKALDVTSLCTYALIAQWGVGDIVAAYMHSDPWAEHRFVQRLAIFVSVALIALQGGWLWRQRTRSSVAR